MTDPQEILNRKHVQLSKNRDLVKKELENYQKDDNLDYEYISDIRKYVIENRDKNAFVKYFKKNCLKELEKNFLADFLDVNSSAEGNTNNPLYGVPVSIKEAMAVKGFDSTCGLVKNCLKPCSEDSVIVAVLKHIGAIPFITTSMAQGGLSIDSSNPVHGVQENPRFKGFLAGGSSGGEGIAISLGLSPIGVGTDIGGSIRFPAAFNGISALKPTYPRLSTKGHVRISEYLPLIFRIVIGPLGRKVEDLADFMRAVLCDYHFQLDPEVIPMKFNENLYLSNKLKIGYYDSFNEPFLPDTVPGVKRGVKCAVESLKALDHDVQPFKVPNVSHGIRLALSCLFADGGRTLSIAYKDEILDKSNEEMGKIIKVPRGLRKLFGSFLLKQNGKFIGSLNKEINGFDSYIESARVCYEAEKYKTEFLKAMDQFDVIICPLFPVPIPKKETKSLLNNIGTVYAFLYNVLNLPAGVVPVDKTTLEDVKLAKEAIPSFERVNDVLNATFHKTQDTEGQPLYVQVVGKPFREEVVLCAMKELEKKSNYKLEMPK